MSRLWRYLWWTPPAVGIVLMCIFQPLRTGDPRHELFERVRVLSFNLSILYIPVALFARLLLRAVRRNTRADAAARGQCEQCGYDLRATPERCPECGAVPSATKGSAT